MGATHPLSASLTRVGNAVEAFRTLLLADATEAEREQIDDTVAAFAAVLADKPWQTPAIKRAAFRLHAAVEQTGP